MVEKIPVFPKASSPLDRFIAEVKKPADLEAMFQNGRSMALVHEFMRCYRQNVKLLELAQPENALTAADLHLVIISPDSAGPNPQAEREQGMYPTIRDWAAQVLLRRPEAVTKETADFILAFLGADHINHPVLQRWMKVAGVPILTPATE